ncbi:hypothetical protein [Novipirellula aureliae]|nr:hypothetical protein [Novipirellula aureliae]
MSANVFVFAAPPPTVAHNSDRGPCPVTHRFIKGGWASKGVGIIGEDLKVEWAEPSEDEISDVWSLDDGGVVHSFSIRKQKSAGIKRYDADRTLKWVYTVATGRDNHSCQPLPSGHFLAGESTAGAAFMVEIDDTGKKIKEVQLVLPEAIKERSLKDIHHVFRNVRKTQGGTYLAACMHYEHAVEWDKDGNLLREFPDCHYAAIRLANGDTLVSGKKGVLQYDANQNLVWAVTAEDFARLNLKIGMICGLQRLPNGNTIISNVKHGNLTTTGDTYKVIELTPAKELVWWVDDPLFADMNLGSVQVLDVNGNATQFEVWK